MTTLQAANWRSQIGSFMEALTRFLEAWRFRKPACTLMICLLLVDIGRADTEWILVPSLTGDWFEPTNWSDGVPGSEDGATIANGGTAEIGNGTASADAVIIGSLSGDGTLVQAGGNLTVKSIYVISRGRFRLLEGHLTVMNRITLDINSQGTETFDWLGGSIAANEFEFNGGLLNLGFDFDVGELVDGTLMGGATMLAAGGRDLDNLGVTQGATALQNATDAFIFNLKVGNGGEGTYVLAADSELTVARVLTVGVDSNATFQQTGGVVRAIDSVVGRLVLGRHAGSSGLYVLDAGELSLRDKLMIGLQGAGEFRQHSGSVTADQIRLGVESDSHGTYHLTGGALSTRFLGVGNGDATGHFIQSGGTVNTGGGGSGQPLFMGSFGVLPGEEYGAIYDLIEGSVRYTGGSGIMQLGFAGSALFRQSGGLVKMFGVRVGDRDNTNRSRYEMSGGRLESRSIFVGNYGPTALEGHFVQSGGVVEVRRSPPEEQFAQIVIAGGKWHQTSGVVTTDVVRLAFRDNSSSEWELHGGRLDASTIFVGAVEGFGKLRRRPEYE